MSQSWAVVHCILPNTNTSTHRFVEDNSLDTSRVSYRESFRSLLDWCSRSTAERRRRTFPRVTRRTTKHRTFQNRYPRGGTPRTSIGRVEDDWRSCSNRDDTLDDNARCSWFWSFDIPRWEYFSELNHDDVSFSRSDRSCPRQSEWPDGGNLVDRSYLHVAWDTHASLRRSRVHRSERRRFRETECRFPPNRRCSYDADDEKLNREVNERVEEDRGCLLSISWR